MVVLQDLLSSQIAGRGVGGKKKRGVRGKGISRGAAVAKGVKKGVRAWKRGGGKLSLPFCQKNNFKSNYISKTILCLTIPIAPSHMNL